MLLDHILYLKHLGIPTFYLGMMSEIGRIAFPVFAIIIVRNFTIYTSSKINFIKRLYFFGVLSQIPFYIYFENNILYLNIILLFAITLNGFYLLESKRLDFRIFGVLLLLLAGLLCEYTFVGVLMLLIGKIYFQSKQSFYLISIFIAIYVLFCHFMLSSSALLAIPFIIYAFLSMPTKKPRPLEKYIFYIFYPAHLVLLSLLDTY